MRKIISFALWGNDPKYAMGALINAALAPKVYPGWQSRFYVGTSTHPRYSELLVELGAEVVHRPEPGDWRGMFWRFLPAGDPDVDVMISRDTDSRLNAREKAAVDDWLAGDKDFHIMRDHPQHDAPILGGMWGARNGVLRDIADLIAQRSHGNHWQVDQQFLRDAVYPRVVASACVHDEFFERRPFPVQRVGYEFVGDVFDGQNHRHPDHWRRLAEALNTRAATPATAAAVGG